MRASETKRAAVARAICEACEENPDHKGDARGNPFRWQDYLPIADAAIEAMQGDASGEGPVTNKHGVAIRRGQIWRDCDKRMFARYALVFDVADGRVIMHRCTANGKVVDALREIRIAVSRLHKCSTGWELVRDVE